MYIYCTIIIEISKYIQWFKFQNLYWNIQYLVKNIGIFVKHNNSPIGVECNSRNVQSNYFLCDSTQEFYILTILVGCNSRNMQFYLFVGYKSRNVKLNYIPEI